MEVRLRKIFGEGVDDAVVVRVPTFLIGRATDCDLRLTCPMVSRNHCELIVRDDYVTVRDLTSKNGTWVNDEPVIPERQLFSGDELRVGMCFFEIIFDPPVFREGKTRDSSLVSLEENSHVIDDAPAVLPA